MTNGDEIPKTKTVKRTVKRGEFPIWVWALLAAMFIVAATGYLGFAWGQQGTQVATGGNTPSGPAGPAPTETQKIGTTSFDRLVGGWRTDKDLNQYMKNFKEIPDSKSRMTIYTPDELLVAGGKGTNMEISIFAGEALVKMGYKNVTRTYFCFTPNGKEYCSDYPNTVTYADKDGNNYFMLIKSPDFPIYSMGKSTIPVDPIPFIEADLGGKVSRTDYHVENFK